MKKNSITFCVDDHQLAELNSLAKEEFGGISKRADYIREVLFEHGKVYRQRDLYRDLLQQWVGWAAQFRHLVQATPDECFPMPTAGIPEEPLLDKLEELAIGEDLCIKPGDVVYTSHGLLHILGMWRSDGQIYVQWSSLNPGEEDRTETVDVFMLAAELGGQ
jgi:hypothetical protein